MYMHIFLMQQIDFDNLGVEFAELIKYGKRIKEMKVNDYLLKLNLKKK